MSTIGNVNQSTPVQGVGVESVTSTGSTLGTEATSLLPEPAPIGSNSVVALAILMTKIDQQDKDQSTKVEDVANVAAAQEDAQRVQSMRDKATQDADGAWASGLGQVAGGALEIAGAGFTDTKSVIDAHDVLTGIGKAAPGAGTIVAGGFKAGADNDDANAAQAEAAAQAEIRRYTSAQTDAQAAADSISKVEQYLQSTLQTEAAARLAAISKS
jgi:hypothetical protein